MQAHTRRHAGTQARRPARRGVRGGKSPTVSLLRRRVIEKWIPSGEAGEFSEEMSACRVNTSNQRSRPHLLRDQGASDAPGCNQKKKKINIQGSTSCSLLGCRFFFFFTCRTKFRTCDLTGAGGCINIATVATTTTAGCGDTLVVFFFVCFQADFARCCPGVRRKGVAQRTRRPLQMSRGRISSRNSSSRRVGKRR